MVGKMEAMLRLPCRVKETRRHELCDMRDSFGIRDSEMRMARRPVLDARVPVKEGESVVEVEGGTDTSR